MFCCHKEIDDKNTSIYENIRKRVKKFDFNKTGIIWSGKPEVLRISMVGAFQFCDSVTNGR